MIPHIPKQRRHAVSVSKPFNDLVAYIEENKDQELHPSPGIDLQFSDLLDYTTNPTDKLTNVDKCLALRTHGVAGLRTAALEMNAVSLQNHRCKDPAYHFLLSWPEHEQPPAAAIFDAAEHAINALGLGEHQYVLAIHGNTDNRHCHIAINRIHPVTYKSRNIEWAKKTLHYAARESEIKHGWTHDNGIYLVKTDRHGNKNIILNPDLGAGKLQPHAHREDREADLPTWHDPDSLESWLKNTVNPTLKRTLPKLQNWHGLHAFLDQHNIDLTDTGGGGMRLKITSQDTGEILELPASKGLRLLKRADLEKRWGPFAASIDTKCTVPDYSNLTPQQLAHGANAVLDLNLDPRTPYDGILNLAEHRARRATDRSRNVHELPAGGRVPRREDGEVSLPNALQDNLGDPRSRQDTDVRPPSVGVGGSSQEVTARHRNDAQRQQRKEERAAARTDLRQRYTRYISLVRQSDPQHTIALKELRTERSTALTALAKESKANIRAARTNVHREPSATLKRVIIIKAEAERRKLQIERMYQQKATELRTTRQPPRGWREWLHEQSNLGDQAAISALRGIVYQAQRDAKKTTSTALDDLDEERAARDAEYREEQHRKVLARLLEEEKNEIAIRSAYCNAMRPHELDALLIRYTDIHWRVTGNGNIEYSDRIGAHLFTDRGNRLTFDRKYVSDQEIKLTLLHAQQKFGNLITMTGNDPIFTARMARLADDMGLTVLNPEQQEVIAEHRAQRRKSLKTKNQTQSNALPAVSAATQTMSPAAPIALTTPALTTEQSLLQPQHLPTELPIPSPELDLEESLRAKVLAIEPHALFIQPDLSNSNRIYSGPVAVSHRNRDTTEGFAQHIGRSQYVLHLATVPSHGADDSYDIQYRNLQPQITLASKNKGKGLAE